MGFNSLFVFPYLTKNIIMKRYCYACIVLALTACTSPKQNAMDGAYKMLSQSFKGAAIDTTFTQHKQVKIYAGDYMMYVRINPTDAVAAFGIGTYSTDSGKLTENIMYSATDTTANTNTFSGTVNITKTDKGYTQVIPEIMSDKGKIRLTEEYESTGTSSASLLDGAWKQVSAYTFSGKDTVQWNDVQYKTYYAGNFVYGDYTEQAMGRENKKHTVATYGTFELTGDSLLKETITASNISALNGQTFDLAIKMNGNDSYTQTVTGNNQKEIAVYQRMKK